MRVKNNIAISDSGFIFNPSTGDSYSLNPIGLEILNLIKEGKNDEQMITYILEHYQTEHDAVEKDIYDFKSMLGKYKILDNE